MLLGTLVLLIAVAPLLGTIAPGGIAGVPIEPVLLAMLLVFVAGFVFLRRLGAERLPAFPLEVPALAFLAAALLGVAFSPTIVRSGFTWVRYAMYVALPIIVAAASVRAENRRLLSWSFLAAGVVTMPRAIAQLITPSAESTQFAIPGTSIDVRVFSFFHNPNPYSKYLAFMIAIALTLALVERGWKRWLATGLLGISTVLVLLTYTRGTWLGLALGIAAGLLLIDLRALLGFVVVGGGLLALVPGALQRLLSAFSLNATTESRVQLWSIAGNLIAEQPLTGVGLGRYLPAAAEYAEAHPALAAGATTLASHSSYLLITAEAGVLAGLMFVWLAFRACRSGFIATRLADGDRRAKLEIAGYTVGIVAFATTTITDNGFQNPPEAVLFWILIGLLAGASYRFWRARGIASELPAVGVLGRALFAPPRTRGRVLLGGRLAESVFGAGVSAEPDLAPWDAPMPSASGRAAEAEGSAR